MLFLRLRVHPPFPNHRAPFVDGSAELVLAEDGGDAPGDDLPPPALGENPLPIREAIRHRSVSQPPHDGLHLAVPPVHQLHERAPRIERGKLTVLNDPGGDASRDGGETFALLTVGAREVVTSVSFSMRGKEKRKTFSIIMTFIQVLGYKYL